MEPRKRPKIDGLRQKTENNTQKFRKLRKKHSNPPSKKLKDLPASTHNCDPKNKKVNIFLKNFSDLLNIFANATIQKFCLKYQHVKFMSNLFCIRFLSKLEN